MFAGIQKPFTNMEKNSRNPPSFLEIKLERLKKKLAETQKELSETKDQLNKQENENIKLRVLLDNYVNPKDEYNKSRTRASKIVFIVSKANKPLRSAEIIALLLRREPVLHEKESKEKFLSPSLNSAIKSKRLIPYKLRGVRGNFYSLPEWVNEEGELSQEMRGKIY
jgi:septal ring factor EnvC (AmiA/AmiB activator)